MPGDRPARTERPESFRLTCSICRRPVELVRLGGSGAFFEPGVAEPHRCPPEALAKWLGMIRLARWGDPRGCPRKRRLAEPPDG